MVCCFNVVCTGKHGIGVVAAISAAESAIPIVWEVAAGQGRLEASSLRHPTSCRIQIRIRMWMSAKNQGSVFIWECHWILGVIWLDRMFRCQRGMVAQL